MVGPRLFGAWGWIGSGGPEDARNPPRRPHGPAGACSRNPRHLVAGLLHRAGLRPRTAAVSAKGSHAVQLGSFSSQQGARRAWGLFAAKNPELRRFHMQITQATVHGKQFWRVAAAGLDGRGAGGLCSKVKSRGGVCFAYATIGNPANAPAYAAKARPKAPALAYAKPAPAGPQTPFRMMTGCPDPRSRLPCPPKKPPPPRPPAR